MSFSVLHGRWVVVSAARAWYDGGMPLPTSAREANDLFTYAEDFLASVVQCFDDCGIEPPPNQFVTACQPTDLCCDTLAVKPGPMLPVTDGSSQGNKCASRWTMDVQLFVSRCVTVFEDNGTRIEPDLATVEADAERILIDRWVVLHCATDQYRCRGQNDVPPRPNLPCSAAEFVNLTDYCLGGCGGTIFTYRLKIG